jgi:hypothetical protein
VVGARADFATRFRQRESLVGQEISAEVLHIENLPERKPSAGEALHMSSASCCVTGFSGMWHTAASETDPLAALVRGADYTDK